MINLTFGNGKVGIKAKGNLKTQQIILGTLDKAYCVGASFDPFDLKPEINLTFETEESLDVLINALQCCKAHFVEIPDELRMGA